MPIHSMSDSEIAIWSIAITLVIVGLLEFAGFLYRLRARGRGRQDDDFW